MHQKRLIDMTEIGNGHSKKTHGDSPDDEKTPSPEMN